MTDPLAALRHMPRLRLAHLPTVLEPMPRLGTLLGIAALHVKRDDCTGLGLGGNKIRKLEFNLAAARRREQMSSSAAVSSSPTPPARLPRPVPNSDWSAILVSCAGVLP